MKGQLGNRSISLNSGEYGSSKQGDRYALVQGRSERHRGESYDLALKQYARIGCQFDLPMFRAAIGSNSSQLMLTTEMEWPALPDRDGLKSGRWGGLRVRHDAGVLFMVLHASPCPIKEVITIDPERNVPVHETLTSTGSRRFSRSISVITSRSSRASGRRERSESRRRIRSLASISSSSSPANTGCSRNVSWFKPENKSRGVVEDVRLDGSRELLDDALRQVGGRDRRFSVARAEIDRKVDVVAVPLCLAARSMSGPTKFA